jgi:hypothetical protein
MARSQTNAVVVTGRREEIMPRSRPNLPDIDILARAYLAGGLSRHPDIAKHVERVEEVEQMGMWKLLTLAKKMGIDPDEMIEKTEQEERALSDYSFNYPGFKGELPFDLTVTLLGKSVTRKATMVYEHTPEWAYYDLRKKAEFKGWASTQYHIELAAVPEVYESDGWTEAAPEWFEAEDMTRNGVLTEEIWETVLDAIDEKCKAADAERRRVAAAQKAATSPTSKKKH